MSTEALVRTEIVNAINGIAGDLDLPNTNTIHPFLREFYHPEKQAEYLNCEIAGAMVARAWGVQVLAGEEALALDNGTLQYSRLYQILIRGYYTLLNGSEVNILIEHARLIRGAIKDLGITLNGQVTKLESIIPLSPSIENAEGGRIVVGDIIYGFLDLNPGY